MENFEKENEVQNDLEATKSTSASNPFADESNDGGGNKSKKKLIVIIIAVILVIAAVFGLFYFFGGSDADNANLDVPVEETVKEGTIPSSDEDRVETTTTTVHDEEFTYSVNQNPVFKDGESEGDLLLASSEDNKSYFKVAITVDETQELLYTSEAVPAGYYIPTIKLEVDLPAGEYACTMNINLYDLETNALEAVMATPLTITVEE